MPAVPTSPPPARRRQPTRFLPAQSDLECPRGPAELSFRPVRAPRAPMDTPVPPPRPCRFSSRVRAGPDLTPRHSRCSQISARMCSPVPEQSTGGRQFRAASPAHLVDPVHIRLYGRRCARTALRGVTTRLRGTHRARERPSGTAMAPSHIWEPVQTARRVMERRSRRCRRRVPRPGRALRRTFLPARRQRSAVRQPVVRRRHAPFHGRPRAGPLDHAMKAIVPLPVGGHPGSL